MTSTRTAPSETVVTRTRLVIGRLQRMLAQGSSGQELTSSQLSAIARIDEHGTLRLGELAALEAVAAPSLTRTIAPLTSGGLVAREPDPNDRRSSLLTLTDTGRSLLNDIRRERSAVLAERIARLSADERATLEAALPVLESLLKSE